VCHWKRVGVPSVARVRSLPTPAVFVHQLWSL